MAGRAARSRSASTNSDSLPYLSNVCRPIWTRYSGTLSSPYYLAARNCTLGQANAESVVWFSVKMRACMRSDGTRSCMQRASGMVRHARTRFFSFVFFRTWTTPCELAFELCNHIGKGMRKQKTLPAQISLACSCPSLSLSLSL